MFTSAPSSSIGPANRFAGAPLPARARRILDALHAQLAQALANPLKLTLVELERELFKQAEHARSSQVQAELYAEARRLREHSEHFATDMVSGLAEELASLREFRLGTSATETELPLQPMALVEHTDIDRDIVLNDIARREAGRCSNALHLLSQRFGVLAARPAFEIEQLPLGPHALCRLLREAGEKLGLSLDSQLMLYHVFERLMRERLAEILEHTNTLLAAEGVLPGLIYLPYLGRTSASRRPSAHRDARPASTPARASRRPLTSWVGQGPAASWSGVMLDEVLPSSARPITQNQADAPTTGIASSSDDAHAPDIVSLRQLLGAARARPAALTPASTGTAHPPVQPPALTEALALLQARSGVGHPMPPAPGRSIRNVHQQLLAMLRESHGQQTELSQQDHNSFDLLGLLYSEITREVDRDTPAAELLVRLQVPLARAALADPVFFVRERHPARELLNAVAESGATWLAEDDADPQLLQKLTGVVDQVVSDYHGDEAVFEHANQQIQVHHQAQARKADMAEHRHVEAARGKERLELAKRLAGDSIEHLCETAAPPKFVQSLLKQAWSDVLTLTLLRQGEHSEEWEQRQKLTDRIAEVTCKPAGEVTDIGLGREIEQALTQIGYHHDEASAIARRLSTPGGEDDITSRTELATRLKARTRLGVQAGADRQEAPPPRTAAEQACYDQLRVLPFGTWFEFVTPPQGDTQRRRLAWYSLVTDHALFVNQRGQKIGEYSLDALARLMASGQLHIVTEDKGRLIDRAWQAAVRALRVLAGGQHAPTSLEFPH
jgi:hypothetical protein